MSLPSCSEQRAPNRAPQLGAGDLLCVREWHSLSDEDLQAVVNDPVEDGLCPGGGAAILLYLFCYK